MNVMPTGKFEVKLEFEDDSFELTSADISADGTFFCTSKKAKVGKPFKMVFVTDDDQFQEFNCLINSECDSVLTGKLNNLSFT